MSKSSPKICIVGNMLTLPYSPDHAGIIQGLEELQTEGVIDSYFIADIAKHQSFGEEAIINTIIANKPDIVLHGMTDSLSMIWPPKIKEKLPNTIQIFSMWDYRPVSLNYDNLWSKWKLSGSALDLVTLSNKDQLDWWSKDFGVTAKFWPHGCVVKDPEFNELYQHETVFVGSRNDSVPYNERVKLIDRINNLTPVKWINEAGSDSNMARIKVWKDLPQIYVSAKTVLDISHFWDSPGYASGRYFYSSGLGGCAVTKRFPGCEELYPEGIKYYFDTPEEAADKIKWLLNNPDIIEETKRVAWEYNRNHHSYRVRFKQLLKWIK